jgi:hypothetical protein
MDPRLTMSGQTVDPSTVGAAGFMRETPTVTNAIAHKLTVAITARRIIRLRDAFFLGTSMPIQVIARLVPGCEFMKT